MRTAALTAVTAGAVLALAACSGSSGGSGGSGASGGASLVVETTFSLKTADPARMFEPTGVMIDHVLYDTLLTFEGADVKTPVPDLATGVTASDDATTYTFPLRTDATFADGSPVTSADVKFSLERVANVKGNPSFLMEGITVSTPDEKTVVLTSATPNPAIPSIVTAPSLGILSEKAVTAAGGSAGADAATADTAEASLNKTSAGSGPYTLTSYSNTSQVVMTRNPKYWGTKPAYEKIVVKNAQANVQKLDVVKGAAQIAVDLSPAQVKGLSRVDVVEGASANMVYTFTNADPTVSAITSNKDFQEAVRYGIDYQSLVALAGEGAVQAPGVVPSTFAGSLPASAGTKRDVAKAKAALAASGIADPTVTMSYASDLQVNGVSLGDIAARVQQNLKEVGITVQLKGSSTQTALEAYRSGKEPMALWYWGPDYPDPNDYLVFLPGQSVGVRAGWAAGADPTLEALGVTAGSQTDAGTRAKTYQQIQTTLNTSGPFMPLIQPAQIVVAQQSVKNVASNPLWLVNLDELG